MSMFVSSEGTADPYCSMRMCEYHYEFPVYSLISYCLSLSSCPAEFGCVILLYTVFFNKPLLASRAIHLLC